MDILLVRSKKSTVYVQPKIGINRQSSFVIYLGWLSRPSMLPTVLLAFSFAIIFSAAIFSVMVLYFVQLQSAVIKVVFARSWRRCLKVPDAGLDVKVEKQ